MHFFTLFAATFATFATAATVTAAPSPCGNCSSPVTPKPVSVDPTPAYPTPIDATPVCPQPACPKPENANTTVRVGSTLDLHPETPLCSLSCAATFAKKFPKFHKLGQLPSAPFYGKIPGAVDGSPKCGSCWKMQYCDQPPVYVIAVDNAAIIQLGKPAFDTFAGADGAKKGSVNATAVEVEPSFCGLC